MTLDRQVNKLLQYLLHAQDNAATASQLAAHLQVSTRQVRNYVVSINAACPQAPVILSTNKGYFLQKQSYHQLMQAEEACCPASPVARQEYILQNLICSARSVDIFDLSEELHVSIPTIESDLKSIRKRLSDFALSIKRTGDILLLTGEESAKRALINSLIRTSSYDQFVLKNEINLLSGHYDHNSLKEKVSQILSEHALFATDYNMQTITLHLIIMIDRIRSGHILREGAWHDLSASPAYAAVKQMREYIMAEYRIAIDDEEFDNLHLIFFNNTTPVNQKDSSSVAAASDYIGREYIEITRQLLIQVCESYYLDPFEEPFLLQFATHIKNLFLRAQTNYQVKNPFTARIKMTCPLIYDISVFIAQQLYTKYQVLINDDEIAFLAFHIGGYFENNLLYQSKLTCLFIYADYYNMHLKMLDRIMKKFENYILIKNAISVFHYTPNMHADFIISTVDMSFDRDHVIVSPILLDSDMEKLEHKIKELRQKKAGELAKRMLSTFLHENLFYRLPTLPDKWETLRRLSEDVIRAGYASEAFLEDILNRERASSTAYYQLALPHNMQDTVYQNFISVVLLEKPVQWEADKQIQMILMLGINQASKKYFSQIFDYLVEVLSDPKCRQRLLSSRTLGEFQQLLFCLIDEKN